ncbi:MULTISPECIES: hemerythrin domain-containing protein [Nioella]|jgi:regulator of cell morphogenesis and NO signaling|uniref:hemerythrin domain-containing protein n=1 Tax=Nioella TaxID=1775424 RepID=UPI000FD856F6|nr:hemerythrin domain-containing protein [Nioella ostreopsis]
MHEPSANAPTGALIDHIQTRYHEVHRRELPDLIWLAGQVEALHATDPNTPHGLTQALEMMIAELDAHMREEEEIVFPALRTGGAAHAVAAVSHLRAAHDGQEAALNRIAAITHGFRLPDYACDSWRKLYKGLGKLAEDLDEHIHLENEVLFPRIENRA